MVGYSHKHLVLMHLAQGYNASASPLIQTHDFYLQDHFFHAKAAEV